MHRTPAILRSVMRVSWVLFAGFVLLFGNSSHASFFPPPSGEIGGYEVCALTKQTAKDYRFSSPVPMQRLMAAVNINGHYTDLMLDTGASKTVIAPFFLKTLQIDYIRKGNKIMAVKGNNTWVPSITIHSLSIGKVTSNNLSAAAAAVPWQISLRGKSRGFMSAGLLGGDFLKAHDAIIDCQRAELLLRENDSTACNIPQTLETNGWQAVCFTFSKSNQIEIPLVIKKQILHFIVDTGAPFSVLNRDIAEKISIIGGWRRFKAYGIGVSDPYAQQGQLNKINIGGFELEHLQIDTSNAWEKVLSDHCDGLLGMNFLGSNLAFIDYQNRTLYLKHPVK